MLKYTAKHSYGHTQSLGMQSLSVYEYKTVLLK